MPQQGYAGWQPAPRRIQIDGHPAFEHAISLRDMVVRRVRSEIISGRVQPGTMYSVPVLAEQVGISTTPVREALLELSRAGLVVPKRNRGFRVVAMSLDELNQLFELRVLLERFAIESLARQRRLDGAALYRFADVVAACVASGDLAGYTDADRSFHEALLTAARNPRLTRLAMELRDTMRLYGMDSAQGRQRQTDSVQEHRQLVDLAVAGKAKAAGELMSRHILDWQPVFAAALRNRPAPDDET